MSHQRGSITPHGRGKVLTQQQRSEQAQQVIEEQRTKALYHLYRTRQLDIAEILGLAPGPVLVPMWRDHLE